MALVGRAQAGDEVIVNTQALDLGLGSGGCRTLSAGSRAAALVRTVRGLRAHLGHRLNTGDVQLLQLANVSEDLIQLAAVGLDFLRGQLQVRQLCDTQHFFAANFHGGSAKAAVRQRDQF